MTFQVEIVSIITIEYKFQNLKMTICQYELIL